MIIYSCSNCNDLECETSICPVCNNRTQIKKSEIYWCKHCNIPLYNKICSCCNEEANYIGTDIRPVFAEERLLLECIRNKPFEFANHSVWNISGNKYIVDGKKIKFSVKEATQLDYKIIKKRINDNKEKNQYYEENYYKQDFIKKFIEANKIRLNYITTEAINYIKEQSKNYSDDCMLVSFSG